MSSNTVLIHTSLRVPKIGGRNIQTSRSDPPARPGIAVSQYSWLWLSSNPM